MKQYAPWIIGAVVVLGGVAFIATGGSSGSISADGADEDDSSKFVPAKVADEDSPPKAGGEVATSKKEGDGASRKPSAAAGADAIAGKGGAAGAAGVADGEPRRRLFEGPPGGGGDGAAAADAKKNTPPAVLPSQREVSVAQKEIRDAFTDATQKKTMECISGFVQKGKSFKGDVVIRLRVKHDAQAKDFTYDMSAIELAGSTNGKLSDFDDETYRCLWDGIGSVKAPQTPRVDEAFNGDDMLAIEVPYSIEVKGEENP